VRVLHCLASPAFTGPAEAVAQLALAQRAMGHEVTVAVDRLRRRSTSEELAAPRFEALGLLDGSGLELSVKSGPVGMLQDAARLRRLELDVVHSHFSHDHALLRLARPAGAVAVRSIHAPRSLRWSTPAADAYTVPTEALARRLVGSLVMVLPALVDASFVPSTDRPRLRAALGLEGGRLHGLVSTFQPSRRHQVALEAFARVSARDPSARLVLVGDGPLEAELRAQVAALPCAARVHFAGYRSGPDYVRWLQALDEVWILGLGNDWSARAAAQARACGVRVVAVDEGALASHADAVVACTPEAVAAAAGGGPRRPGSPEPAAEVARRVVGLYERARAHRAEA
jgi:glycosyltransferase involved in cell wall biosynthesis